VSDNETGRHLNNLCR